MVVGALLFGLTEKIDLDKYIFFSRRMCGIMPSLIFGFIMSISIIGSDLGVRNILVDYILLGLFLLWFGVCKLEVELEVRFRYGFCDLFCEHKVRFRFGFCDLFCEHDFWLRFLLLFVSKFGTVTGLELEFYLIYISGCYRM